jgi:hypothetical protein
MKIFIPVVGQFTNVGDTLHRKILIGWLHETNVKLHIYVGKAPVSFIQALNLKNTDTVYKSYVKWAIKIFISTIISKVGFIYNPGEINLRTKRFILEMFLLPLQFLIWLRGGFILRVGIAYKSDKIITNKLIWNFVFLFTNEIYWRTIKSYKKFKRTAVIPDLAFYDVDAEINFENKKYLVISMRGDRSKPNELWYDVINKIVLNNKLIPIVVSQVRIDNERTIEIANNINAKAIIWEDEKTHYEQEKLVNNIYRESVIAVSDRLHVLIAAYTKGAIPVNLAVTYSTKVQDHFDVLPIKNVTINYNNFSQEEIVNQLTNKFKEGFDEKLLNNSKQRLVDVKNHLKKKYILS